MRKIKKYQVIFISMATVIVSLFSPMQSVYASLNPADYVGQGIDHYGDECSASTLAGGDNATKIFNYLSQKGLSAAAAAGILGNMQAESALNPFRMQDPPLDNVLPIDQHKEYNKAWGLVQWDGGRRQQILTQVSQKWSDYKTTINNYGTKADGYKSAGTANDDYLSFELDYLWQELTSSYQSALNGLKAVPNTEAGARSASVVWDQKYEISDGSASDARADNAAKFYTQFAGSSSGSTTSSTGDNSCSSGQITGNVVYYSQLDSKWASHPYAGGSIGPNGCGPTSMAIILASLYDNTITPIDVADAAGVQTGEMTSSYANLINGVNAKYASLGLNISTQPVSFSDAIAFVQSGKGYVWIGGSGPPPFTTGGHMLAIVGVSSDGQQVTIADPDTPNTGHQQISNYPVSQIQAGVGAGIFEVPKKPAS